MEKPKNIQDRLRFAQKLILVISIVSGCVLFALLVFLPIDERILATGTVRAAHDSHLYAPEDGILDAVLAQEGEEVKKGQTVLRLDATAHRARLTQIEAELKEATAAIDLQKAKLEATQKLPLPKEFWHMGEELTIAREELKQKQVEYERSEELMKKGLISAQELERARLAVELAKSGEAKAEDKLRILNEGLEATIMHEAQAQIKNAEAQKESLAVEQELCREQIERCELRAPEDGTVTLILKHRPGERVSRGEDLAHVSHGPPTRADLFAGENEMHRVQPGMYVLMKSRSFDTLRHGYIEGKVVKVALEPERQSSGSSSDLSAGYRIVVEITRSPEPLVLGATLEGKVILQRIPLWQLLLPSGLRGSGAKEISASHAEK